MSEPTAQDHVDESVTNPVQLEFDLGIPPITGHIAMYVRECWFCEKQVTDEQYDTAYHQMTTWVHGPKRNGDIFRNYTGTVAHKECVENASRGIAPDQRSLFDE